MRTRKFQVRAERKGNGDGRIYTVRYQAEDDNGNTTPAEGTVSVAKNQRKK
jgi:endo-1,4-beta-xylanase